MSSCERWRPGPQDSYESVVFSYSPALDAVLLAYSNIEFDDSTANIVNDCPFAVCDIWFDAVVWAPKVGMKLCELRSELCFSIWLACSQYNHRQTEFTRFLRHHTSPSSSTKRSTSRYRWKAFLKADIAMKKQTRSRMPISRLRASRNSAGVGRTRRRAGWLAQTRKKLASWSPGRSTVRSRRQRMHDD